MIAITIQNLIMPDVLFKNGMTIDYKSSAEDFLELSSEQRLAIIQKLLSEKSKLSILAKELGATSPEVYRNLQRLEKSGIIQKDADNYYTLTTYGNSICSLIPSLIFISKNKDYFKDHDFGGIPQKFIQRVGALIPGQYVTSFTRVLETWKSIFNNSEEYIYGILIEEPLDIIEPLIMKAKKGVLVNSIFSESTIIPDGRGKLLEKLGIHELAKSGAIERKMLKEVKVSVLLNEKEACVMFPNTKGEPDIGNLFYSKEPSFHEWCLDYFRYSWHEAKHFQEKKLEEKKLN